MESISPATARLDAPNAVVNRIGNKGLAYADSHNASSGGIARPAMSLPRLLRGDRWAGHFCCPATPVRSDNYGQERRSRCSWPLGCRAEERRMPDGRACGDVLPHKNRT